MPEMNAGFSLFDFQLLTAFESCHTPKTFVH